MPHNYPGPLLSMYTPKRLPLWSSGLRLHAPTAGGPGSIPGQGTINRARMLQLRAHVPQWRSPVVKLRPGVAYIYMYTPKFNILLNDGRRRQWHPTPVLLPGKSHGRRSLVGCSPWGREESDTTERLHFHFSLSCVGEENGNPLQYSCLENPMDGGAWWAAVYGVTQSRTRLKRLSSSSSSKPLSRPTESHCWQEAQEYWGYIYAH